MAKDIEKIIDTVDIPKMEYTKTSPRRKTVSAEVPEVVLPKTKAEMYEEAKGRLTQKTTPVSRTYDPNKRKTPRKRSVKTVELESAAAAVVGAASIAENSEEKKDAEFIKKKLGELRKIVDAPKWVGSADELIPFAWRHPLVDVPRPTKIYRAVVKDSREALLPVPRKPNA